METKDIEYLEKAVINLIVENAKIKQELAVKTKDSNMWYGYYNDKNKLVGELEIIITELKFKKPQEDSD